mmetsp:Transcript_52232/g.138428  ORF Transcript_52232/g.138428 Transcript_52232/m.138428 type:complete len:155 (-) Transcript_52232:709-1173(-)
MRKAVVELDSDEDCSLASRATARPALPAGTATCSEGVEVTATHTAAAAAIVAELECSRKPAKRLKEAPRVVIARGNAMEYLWARIRDSTSETPAITATSLRACLSVEGVAATDSEVATMLELYGGDGSLEMTYEQFQKAVSDAQLKVSKAGRVW